MLGLFVRKAPPDSRDMPKRSGCLLSVFLIREIMLTEKSNFQKIAESGALFSFGTLSTLVLQFFAGLIVIRAVERSEYGLISLGNVLINIIVMLAVLGFGNGVPRFIALYREQGKNSSVNNIIVTTLLMVFTATLFWVFFAYFSTSFISGCFKKPEMQRVIRIFLLMIPPLAFMRTFTAIFRGIENTVPKVLFQDIALNLCKLLLLLLVLGLGLGFQGILWTYVISVWAAFTAYAIYGMEKLTIRKPFHVSGLLAKDLVLFSLPLMGTSLIGNLLSWAGTLTLGYLRSAGEVGLYSAPLRLASFIAIPLTALVFLYLPVGTKLFQQSGFEDLKRLYVSTTKWAFFLSMPLILYFLLDAQFIVTKLFGETYRDSANILRIMAIGFSIHTFLGPNGITLISIGNTQLIFVGALFAGISALLLCLMLIPPYGAIGAALAMASARALSNVFVSFCLYLKAGIHPFTRHYVKPIAFAFVAALLVSWPLSQIQSADTMIHLMIFFFIIPLMLVSPMITRSLDSKDLEFFAMIEHRLHGKIVFVNRIAAHYQQKE